MSRVWKSISIAMLFAALGLNAFGATRSGTATLYSPLKYKHEFNRASFDFSAGRLGTTTAWQLMYGNLHAGDDWDWFATSGSAGERSVIRDLGLVRWSRRLHVPVLEPRPQLQPGQHEVVTVNTSGGEYDEWRDQNARFVRAVVGHTYALHVKNLSDDYYVLLRVDDIQRGDHCAFTWKRVKSPR